MQNSLRTVLRPGAALLFAAVVRAPVADSRLAHYTGIITGRKGQTVDKKELDLDLLRKGMLFRNMTDEEEQAMKKELEAINFFERCNQF